MTHSIQCGTVMPGCQARFEADSEEELLSQIGAHAAAEHGLTAVTDDQMAAIKGAIQSH